MVEKRKIAALSGVEGVEKKGRFRRGKVKAAESTAESVSTTEELGKDADLSELQQKMVVGEEESKDAIKKAQLRLEKVDFPQSPAPVKEDPVVVDETKPSAKKIGMLARFSSRFKSSNVEKKEAKKMAGKKEKTPKVKHAKKSTAKSAVVAGKSDVEGLEADSEVVALGRKMVDVDASLKRFDKNGTLKPLDGYQEKARYWVEEPYSWVAILFNPEENERMYYLVEPSLTPSEKTVLEMLHEHLLDRLTYDESRKDRDAVIVEKVKELLDEYEITLDEDTVNKLIYYLKRSYIGYGRIDAFLKDPRIEDISCDGLVTPIFLYHQDYQNIRTNVSYDNELELDLFIGRLVERAGKSISLGKPTVDATLPQGYRLQATMGKEITTKGSTFTIRKYREQPFTPVDLVKYRTFSPEMLAYLWLAAENKRNIVIVGGTASGKTCTLNAISLFMPPDAKIVSIEDTRELQLYQENWVAAVTRPAYGEKAITMYDLLAQALRQRPEIIMVGEVRGPEALSLFQAMTTGHTSYSTMHAGSIQEMVFRLEGEPINVPHHMLASLDIVCIQLLSHVKEARVRRNQSILEIGGVDPESGALKTNRLFERDPVSDKFEMLGDSIVMGEIMRERGWSALRLKKELDNRQKVLEYLAEHNITTIDEVSKIIRQYYFDPEKVMKEIGIK